MSCSLNIADPKGKETGSDHNPLDSFDPRILDPELDNPLAKDTQLVTDALRDLSQNKSAALNPINLCPSTDEHLTPARTEASKNSSLETAADEPPSPDPVAQMSARDQGNQPETQRSVTPLESSSADAKSNSKGKRKSEAAGGQSGRSKRKKTTDNAGNNETEKQTTQSKRKNSKDKGETAAPTEGASGHVRSRRVYVRCTHILVLPAYFFVGASLQRPNC